MTLLGHDESLGGSMGGWGQQADVQGMQEGLWGSWHLGPLSLIAVSKSAW